MKAIEERLQEALAGFEFDGTPVLQGKYGNGHINFTYLIHVTQGEQTVRDLILQQMNRSIFKKPVEVMENILGVTSSICGKKLQNGGDRSGKR